MRLSGKGCSHHKGVYVCVRGNWSQELAKNSLLVVIGDFAKRICTRHCAGIPTLWGLFRYTCGRVVTKFSWTRVHRFQFISLIVQYFALLPIYYWERKIVGCSGNPVHSLISVSDCLLCVFVYLDTLPTSFSIQAKHPFFHEVLNVPVWTVRSRFRWRTT